MQCMMTSSNGNIFRVTGPLWGGVHRSPVNFPHKGQWCGALMFSLICAWTNGWANHRDAGELRRNCSHYDVNVMLFVVDIVQVQALLCERELKSHASDDSDSDLTLAARFRDIITPKGRRSFFLRASVLSTTILFSGFTSSEWVSLSSIWKL